MVWGSDETCLFIKLYLSHNCLWNTEDENYKHRHKRREAYQDLSKKFQALTNILMTEYEVKQKIKNLRSTYCQELKKIQQRDDSIEIDPNQSNLKWFHDMYKAFSTHNIPNYLYEKRASIDDQQGSDAQDSSQVWMPAQPLDDSETNGVAADETSFPDDPNGDYILLLKNEPYQDPVDVERKPFKTRKRKIKIRQASTSDHDTETKTSLANEDEYDIYGKYIASQLRSMGVERAMRVQLKIQSIVSEARIESLKSK